MTSSPGQDTTSLSFPPGHYTIDPEQSGVTFRTRHVFGLAPVRGRFAVCGGQIEVADPVERSRATAEIDATSFDTGNHTRDDTVRSARYLRTTEYPSIDFASAGVHRDGAAWTVAGQLTVRGSTAPVRLRMLSGSHAGDILEASARTRIDRREFGITAQPGMTGRYLDLLLLVVAHAV